MADKTTDVLVSTDGGRTWQTHPEVPGAPKSAIKRVRDTNPELLADEDALFWAPYGNPVAFKKQMVATYAAEPMNLPAVIRVAEEAAASDG